MSAKFLTWHGVSRSGSHAFGRTIGDASALVQAKFKARWRSLEVHDETGEIIGAIHLNDDTRRRVWWAAS